MSQFSQIVTAFYFESYENHLKFVPVANDKDETVSFKINLRLGVQSLGLGVK